MPMMVSDLIDLQGGVWKEDLVPRCFVEKECSLILGMPVSLAGCEDRVIWHYAKNGDYTVRTGYGVAVEMQENGEFGRRGTGGCSRREVDESYWRDIWRLAVPNKLKLFIWRCCTASLAVRVNLIRRHMRVESMCVLCGLAEETEHHLFFECEFSRVMWYSCSL